jgi:hypothetical protein
MPRINRYSLYERAVQSPAIHAQLLAGMYRQLRGRYARDLREDFCGTFAISCEWIKRNRRNAAVCIDLDKEPLSYGRKAHRSKLKDSQKDRLRILNQDVLTPTSPKSDLIVSCNFSFFVFKQRKIMKDYLRGCFKSLRERGVLILEIAGGPGMIEKSKDRKPVYDKGKHKFTYVWDQVSFDPITSEAKYAIHFHLPGRKPVLNAFTYDWRIWSIAEIRELMAEAGFSETRVFWETEYKGKGTGEYVLAENGDNAYSWVAYIAGMKD